MTEQKNTGEKTMKLEKIVKYKITVEVLTGLHIGGSSDSIQIGGIDNTVIKIPYLKRGKEEYYNVPYIPGSSLKGKLRSLLELAYGEFKKKGENEKDNKTSFELIKDNKNNEKLNLIEKLFGSSSTDSNEPIRARFEDLYPTDETFKLWHEKLNGMYVEDKVENGIDRITSKADNPRHTERVIPGSKFEGYITIRYFNSDLEEYNNVSDNKEQDILTNNKYFNLLKEAKELLENDYLGGNGSRGYGRVKIEIGNRELVWPKPEEETTNQ